MSNDLKLVVPGITDPNRLVCLARARTFKQYCAMVNSTLAGECVFCDPTEETIVFESPLWLAWKNRFPEKHTRLHLIVVPTRHVLTISDLTFDEWHVLFTALSVLEIDFCYSAAGLMVRDNAPELAGTEEHLHWHVMVPDGTGRVESPFCKAPAEELKSLRRAIVFEKLRQGGSRVVSLTAEEHALVDGRME